jgi:SAM-dependent methyltransferase
MSSRAPDLPSPVSAAPPPPSAASRVPADPASAQIPRPRTGQHLCPVWAGWLIASPIRRLVEDPVRRLASHVRPGTIALDLGCAMGFFSLPLARLVGPAGRVICVDVQEKMIEVLRRRARRRRLEDRIEVRIARGGSLPLEDLAGRADFALAWHVVHEARDAHRFLADAFTALRPGGRLLLSEPRGHVRDGDRAAIFALAEYVGFRAIECAEERSSDVALLERPEGLD